MRTGFQQLLRYRRWFPAVIVLGTLLSGCHRGESSKSARSTPAATSSSAASIGSAGRTASGPPPWQRTEQRPPCANFNLLRNPYFGDVHVHTTYSFDAVTGDVRTGPLDAYHFAQGKPIPLPPYDAQNHPQRTVQLSRPLDFTAVTDHSEFFGETSLCLDPQSAAYRDPLCVTFRNGIPQLTETSSAGIAAFAVPYNSTWDPQTSKRFSFCYPNGDTASGAGPQICQERASVIWNATQEAAARAYDDSAACTFTSFVGYEWTGTPNAQNIHRNVIFRNNAVPGLPVSYVDESTPQGLWTALKKQCLDAPALNGRCDVLVIPHNSNLSNGLMFAGLEDANGDPLITAGEAAFRAAMEPLIEVVQHKGDSECRPGVGGALSNDELCGFEKWHSSFIGYMPPGPAEYSPLLYVRNALKLGLGLQQKIGVNPLQLGMIGSTDTHNSTPGNVREYENDGHLGTRDASPENLLVPLTSGIIGGIEANPGGLAVVWAEENSRDAIFSAMRRRETYSTSGTRPLVRFFGGELGGVTCGAPDFVERAYQTSVPMGGELGAAERSPRFAVLAMQDPGEDQRHPGTPLQRIQIVKGWIDNDGKPQEHVFDVAGNPNDGSSVDTRTCTASSKGAPSLCTVWTDPDFTPSQRAFYYARVVEDPVCRWSTRLCNAQRIDCGKPDSVPPALATCCDARYPKTIQERALTSPIWYRPEAVGALHGEIRFGEAPRTDVLQLTARMGHLPAGADPQKDDVVLTMRDDDTIFNVTVPAAKLQQVSPGRFEYQDEHDSLRGLKRFVLAPDQGSLELTTVPMDLVLAHRSEHMVELQISVGTYQSAYSRLWTYQANPARLVTE